MLLRGWKGNTASLVIVHLFTLIGVNARYIPPSPPQLAHPDWTDGGEGGYYNKCRNVTIGHYWDDRDYHSKELGFSIEGTCESLFGGLIHGWAYLDRCYNFDERAARFVPVTDGKGGFYRRCGECRLAQWPNDMILSCSCYLPYVTPPHWDMISVNLDAHIHVRNGVIGCPGSEGEWN